jgi:hypothetical protein
MSTQGSSKTRNPGLREERRWRTRRYKLVKMEVIFGYFQFMVMANRLVRTNARKRLTVHACPCLVFASSHSWGVSYVLIVNNDWYSLLLPSQSELMNIPTASKKRRQDLSPFFFLDKPERFLSPDGIFVVNVSGSPFLFSVGKLLLESRKCENLVS